METIKIMGFIKIVTEVDYDNGVIAFEVWDIEGRPCCFCKGSMEIDTSINLAHALLAAAGDPAESNTGLHDDNGYDPETAGIE